MNLAHVVELSEVVKNSGACWLGTIGLDEVPDVIASNVYWHEDGQQLLAVSQQKSQVVRNLRINPKICVAITQEGQSQSIKLKGKATVVEKGHPKFRELERALLEQTFGVLPILSIICVEVARQAPSCEDTKCVAIA